MSSTRPPPDTPESSGTLRESPNPLGVRAVTPTGTAAESPNPLGLRLASAAEDELRPGTVVAGRYEVVRELARGGMGVVYSAHDRVLRRDIAIKTLQPEFRDHPTLVARFREEAEITGRLQHPGVPPVREMPRTESRRWDSGLRDGEKASN